MAQKKTTFTDFFSDPKGAIGVLAALFLPVLVIISVGCIEVSRKAYVESQLAFAVDAAALAGARYDINKYHETALKIFNANFPPETHGITVHPNISYDPRTGILAVKVDTHLSSELGLIIGMSEIALHASSFIKREMDGLEAVLVVDNYESMSQFKKMDTFKESAIDFIDYLFEGFSTNASASIGIVPYAALVNVGTNNVEWLTIPTDPLRFPDDQPWQGCIRANSYDETGDEDFVRLPKGLKWPIYLAQTTLPPIQDDCSIRDNDWDITTRPEGERQCPPTGPPPEGTPTFKALPPLKGVNVGPNRSCVMPMLPLSKDAHVIKTAIKNMTPIGGGGRMINIGLIWGARMLSETWKDEWKIRQPDGNLIEGIPIQPYNKRNHTKAIILVVDGPNHWFDNPLPPIGDPGSYGAETEDRYIPGKLGSINIADFARRLDQKTSRICNAMKKQGIEIFVINLDPRTAQTAKVCQECATDSAHYIPINEIEMLPRALRDTVTQLRHLRLWG